MARRFLRAAFRGSLVLAGWLIVFGGGALGCARIFGPIAMHEGWSDTATWWMFPASAVMVVAGATVIWLGSRLWRSPS